MHRIKMGAVKQPLQWLDAQLDGRLLEAWPELSCSATACEQGALQRISSVTPLGSAALSFVDFKSRDAVRSVGRSRSFLCRFWPEKASME
ncbi:hypothetical protein [Mycetohabitans endofungorum]|uniref:hypothetical protein n=1 Tax=Mycetohabitans endofungorum TaxID=417203 RepID=UPI002B057386|nr:hypothetical protein [Mycetohabitans endofungorum]